MSLRRAYKRTLKLFPRTAVSIRGLTLMLATLLALGVRGSMLPERISNTRSAATGTSSSPPIRTVKPMSVSSGPEPGAGISTAVRLDWIASSRGERTAIRTIPSAALPQ